MSEKFYPNQQLRSVSLETYFPGRLRALGCLGEIQEKLQDKLANLFVPNIMSGDAAALRPFQLRDEDSKRSVAIAVNQATFIAFDYPGYSTFVAEALETLALIHESLGVSALNRVVYRYENFAGLGRTEEGGLPVAQAFPGVLPRFLTDSSAVQAFESMLEAPWSADGRKGTEGFHARVEPSAGTDTLLVAVHASEEGPTDSLQLAAGRVHQRAQSVFERVISDEFRKFIAAEANAG